MAEEDNFQDNYFICGVVEGFYGRPWTTEQRKDLFRKLKKWGMNSYVYAPKDDYKHRAYWRELYTVEETDHLTSLIQAAKQQNINFYYALSPGLDITYSSVKEITALKRKLEQVSSFGCEHFALLFDDIESEMSKPDKEVFQSFAHAQVTISNDVYDHLNCSKFLFCPTQYCSTRAVPSVTQSEYLSTLGSKLNKNIDIFWTGSKVITKTLTTEGIQEITEVLQRKPVIWDNLHANDYDQKRVFLGPYQGRSPELIPLLRGVVTNPNCEFHANTIAIHSLARWSKCSSDTKVSNSISADIRLETENEDGITLEDAPAYMTENTYHPRQALKSAILEWLPEFFQEKQVFGPIVKPHPPVAIMPIIPILPSVNTCMSLTTCTTSTTTSAISNPMPEINTTDLQNLAEVCSTVGVSEPIANSVMNSLVSPTKVITTESIHNPILSTSVSNLSIPNKIPISSVPIPLSSTMHSSENDSKQEDSGNSPEIVDAQIENNEDIEKIADDKHFTENHMNVNEDTPNPSPSVEPMDCGSGMMSPKHNIEIDNISPTIDSEPESQKHNSNKPMTKSLHEDVIMSETVSNGSTTNSMQVESSSDTSLVSNSDVVIEDKDKDIITADDILLLCDLFFLPFEHGLQGLKLLNEFHWLKVNSGVLSGNKNGASSEKPEVQEWFRRSEGFLKLCDSVFGLARKIAGCSNRELCYDLFTYVWEIASVVSLLSGYVKWLALGQFPTNINSFTQGSYTWFSKGWKETFTSGDQEPWVFRGGLIADLQRLIPVDSGNDLFIYKLPEVPTLNFYGIRPFMHLDEREVYAICHKTCRDGTDCTELFPENLQEIATDRLIAPFVTMHPEFCMVVENSEKVLVGYACAALDSKRFYQQQEMCWVPEMCEKYPLSLLDSPNLTQTAKDSINHFHNFKYDCPQNVLNSHPSILNCCILQDQIVNDQSVSKRLISVLLAALRSHGSFGVHAVINTSDCYMQDFYKKLGFVEIYQDDINSRLYLGRNF